MWFASYWFRYWRNTGYYQDRETGLLGTSKRYSGLSKSKKCVIEDKDLEEKLANSGYKMVKVKFSWKKVANKYINIYKTLLKTE